MHTTKQIKYLKIFIYIDAGTCNPHNRLRNRAILFEDTARIKKDKMSENSLDTK